MNLLKKIHIQIL